jgi:hypothetical protein
VTIENVFLNFMYSPIYLCIVLYKVTWTVTIFFIFFCFLNFMYSPIYLCIVLYKVTYTVTIENVFLVLCTPRETLFMRFRVRV